MFYKLQIFAKDIFLNLKPSKFTVFTWLLRFIVMTFILGFYFSEIKNQMERDSNVGLIDGFGKVIKNQYDYITDSFMFLLKRAEGYRDSFYADNKGYAVGYGYNPTQNSVEYNKNILDYAGVDKYTQDIILKNASKYKNTSSKDVPSEFKQIKFTKEQLDRMATYAQNSYERSFFRVLNLKLDQRNIHGVRRDKILNAYVGLDDNKKAVLTHMSYKVGEANLSKYNQFFDSFIDYLERPTDSNKNRVANSFTYKFKQNGVVLRDTRVEHMHHDLFVRDTTSVSNKTSTKLTKTQLNDLERFNKAMDEVKTQIGMNMVWKMMVRVADGLNNTMSKHQDQNEPEYDGYFEG